MKKFLLNLFLCVVALALIIFLVANRQEVMINIDPVNLDSPALAIGPLPMWAAMSITMGVGFGLGAIGMYMSDGTLRRKARERKREIRRLQSELELARRQPPTVDGTAVAVRS